MNRRDFFKKSSIALSTIAIAGAASDKLNKLLAKGNANEHFSLEIITDKPVKAIKLAEEFFKAHSFEDKIIKFSQYPVEGEFFGDLAFVHKGKLVNYKSASGSISSNLKEIAKSLELPKKVSNPSRIKFYTADENSPAERFLIFHKGSLIKTITTDGDTFNINVQGSKGNVMINFENNKAKVVQSACSHKTCINSGSISLSGESIVCIPNEILIVAE